MYVLGGIIDGEQSSTVEIWDDDTQQWQAGTDMPEVRARFCAVPVDSRFLAVIGGEMDGKLLNSMKTLDLETNEWRMQSQTLKVARKDHACVATRLDDEEGILVAGGVAAQEFLASVEQLDSSNDQDIPYQREWRLVSQALSVPRYDFALAHIPTARVNRDLVCKKP